MEDSHRQFLCRIDNQNHNVDIDRGQEVIDSDAPTAGQRLALMDGPGFEDIEEAKCRKDTKSEQPILRGKEVARRGQCAGLPTQAKKQTGMAVISSTTTEPGSFRPSSFSPTPDSQTEPANPAMAPAMRPQRLPLEISSANQNTPSTEPNVPGATGIRPKPKPCAKKRATFCMGVFTDPANRWPGCATSKARRK